MNATEQALENLNDPADYLVEFVRRRDWVSFVEVQKTMVRFFPTEGSFEIGSEHLNVVWWVGMSDELSKLLVRLIWEERRLHLHPASLLTYMIDGGMPRMEAASRLPRSGRFKERKWAPACLRVFPLGKPKRGRKLAS